MTPGPQLRPSCRWHRRSGWCWRSGPLLLTRPEGAECFSSFRKSSSSFPAGSGSGSSVLLPRSGWGCPPAESTAFRNPCTGSSPSRSRLNSTSTLLSSPANSDGRIRIRSSSVGIQLPSGRLFSIGFSSKLTLCGTFVFLRLSSASSPSLFHHRFLLFFQWAFSLFWASTSSSPLGPQIWDSVDKFLHRRLRKKTLSSRTLLTSFFRHPLPWGF